MPIVRDGRNRVDTWRTDGIVVRQVHPTATVVAPRIHHDAGLARLPRPRRVLGPRMRRKSLREISERDARAQRVVDAMARFAHDDPSRFELVAEQLGLKVNAVAIIAKHAAIRKAATA